MSDDFGDHIDAILAQWRRERPDLDLAPMAILGRLFRATALADAALAPPLAALGLQPGWTDLLAALRRAGRPYELNPTDLRRATMLTSGGITKRLDRLAEAGLVQRRPDPSDRRGTLVRLTRKGKAVIERAMPTHLANQERLLRSLTLSERRTLERLLGTLLAGLERSTSGANGVRTVAAEKRMSRGGHGRARARRFDAPSGHRENRAGSTPATRQPFPRRTHDDLLEVAVR